MRALIGSSTPQLGRAAQCASSSTSQFTVLLGSLTSLPSVQTSLQRSLSRRQLTLHPLTQPQDPIADRAQADGTSVSYWTVSNDAGFAAGRASGRDVALVFITADSGEAQYTVEGNQGDRNNLQAWHSGVRCIFPCSPESLRPRCRGAERIEDGER